MLVSVSTIILQISVASVSIWYTLSVKRKKAVTLDGIEKGNSTSCSITQCGKDGFGHQYEAKLSCMILATLLPGRFKYMHTPFERFEHISTTPRILNEYVNLEKGSHVQITEAVGHKGGMKRSSTLLESELLEKWMNLAAYSNTGICDEKVVYVIDNCWDIVYSATYAARTTELITTGVYRRMFLSTQKPETGFDHSRPNVVIHIRRGDAGERIQDESYFEKAITYYNMTLFKSISDSIAGRKHPLFWVESDEPSWTPIKGWYEKYPNDFRLPNEKEDLMKIFNRLVMADGIIMSYSSISHAAVYLNAAKALLTVSGSLCFSNDPEMRGIAIRKEWYRTDRFLIINESASIDSLISRTSVVNLSSLPSGMIGIVDKESEAAASSGTSSITSSSTSMSANSSLNAAAASVDASTRMKSSDNKNDRKAPAVSSQSSLNTKILATAAVKSSLLKRTVDDVHSTTTQPQHHFSTLSTASSNKAAEKKTYRKEKEKKTKSSIEKPDIKHITGSDSDSDSRQADNKESLDRGVSAAVAATTTSKRQCLLTQFGTDGFGHQYEGKLSCILLSYLLPEQFAYLHTPSRKFAHSTIPSEELNQFTNLAGGGFPLADKTIKSDARNMRKGPFLRSQELNHWIRNATDQPTKYCEKGVVYVVDNCWAIAYREPQASMIIRPEYRDKIRGIYFASEKPGTGFDRSRPNVVIHIRRGDAGVRIQGEAYYNAAIAYYNKTFGSGKYRVPGTTNPYPLFWIESDDIKWEPIKRWQRENPSEFRVPHTDDNFIVSMHRMVMADGLIMSYSSVSNAAALLNNATAPLLVSGSLLYDEANQSSLTQILLRRPWMETSRFVIINATDTKGSAA